jgi:hypothetical protein
MKPKLVCVRRGPENRKLKCLHNCDSIFEGLSGFDSKKVDQDSGRDLAALTFFGFVYIWR